MLIKADRHVPLNRKNDVFRVIGENISEFKGVIYNRWGELLYEWGVNKGWDVSYKGHNIPDGIYIYVVKATGNDVVEYGRRGTLLVIR